MSALVFLVATLVALGVNFVCIRGFTRVLDRIGRWAGAFFVNPAIVICVGVTAALARAATRSSAYGVGLLFLLVAIWIASLMTWSSADRAQPGRIGALTRALHGSPTRVQRRRHRNAS